jgi:hypothetical protein
MFRGFAYMVRIKAFPMTKPPENENKFPAGPKARAHGLPAIGRSQKNDGFMALIRGPGVSANGAWALRKKGGGQRQSRHNSKSYRTPNHPDA